MHGAPHPAGRAFLVEHYEGWRCRECCSCVPCYYTIERVDMRLMKRKVDTDTDEERYWELDEDEVGTTWRSWIEKPIASLSDLE